jgi:O-antigen/teichoic acid export membrane protein
MTTLRINILANYVGQIWMALMGVVFVPLYIKALGMEAFGLIGLMISLQAISLLLDLGMGGVLNRELARRSHAPEASHTMGSLVRTLELLVWPTAIAIYAIIWLASGTLAHHWLHPKNLTPDETAHAIIIMGFAVALQWPSSFYSNGLSGLERQPILNLINAGFATLRGAGVLPIIYWISPSINAFIWWYAAMGACQSLTSAVALWYLLPCGNYPARFRLRELRATGGFAGGLLIITALSITLTQLDRIVLSRMRPLEDLGYYSLALSIAAGLGRMIQPMFNALYPRYSRLVAANDHKKLISLYHLSNQYLAIVISSVSMILIFFSNEIILLWTNDAFTANKVALPLSILVAGTAFNGLMNLPYALQLAHGWTRLAIGSNIVALMLGTPLCIWAVDHYGVAGAACLWLMVNLGNFLIGIPLMHHRLMQGESMQWYLRDVIPAFIGATIIVLPAKYLLQPLTRTIGGGVQLFIICALTLFTSAMMLEEARKLVRNMISKRSSHIKI